MAILLNTLYPQMRIHIPATGGYRAFLNGKLEIEKDDPDYEVVMAEALRTHSIVVYESVTTCDRCGEVFTGKAAPMQLGKHRKDAHFDVWLAEKDLEDVLARNAEVKAREGFGCDVCKPATTWPTEEELAIHVKVMHTSSPSLDEEGNG